jgi:hypothetical protein
MTGCPDLPAGTPRRAASRGRPSHCQVGRGAAEPITFATALDDNGGDDELGFNTAEPDRPEPASYFSTHCAADTSTCPTGSSPDSTPDSTPATQLGSDGRLGLLPAAMHRPRRVQPSRGAVNRQAGARLLPFLPDRRSRPRRPNVAPMAPAGAGLLRHQRQQRSDQPLDREDRRHAPGFRKFANHRLRNMLVADGTQPYRTRPAHA